MIGPANSSLVPRVSLCYLQVLDAMGKATLFSVPRKYSDKKLKAAVSLVMIVVDEES